MTNERRLWVIWIIGLMLFALAIVLSLLITRGDVTLGIMEHQAAGTAERVNEIQEQWREGGVRGLAIAAMLADLVFIGVFAWGSYLLGRMFVANGRLFVRLTGMAVVAAAVAFGVTDYIETILQVIQLLRDQGSDWMASTAATVRPIKVAAWCVCFFGLLLALAVRRIASAIA